MKGFGEYTHSNIDSRNLQLRRVLILIVSIILLIVPLSMTNLPATTDTDQTILQDPSNSSRDVEENWTLTKEIEYTTDIDNANDFYLKVSPRAEPDNRLIIKPEPNPNEFLSKTALEAIDQSPDWLKEDLTEKFIDLAQTRLSMGDDASSAFADLDADGDLDMVCSTYFGKILYFKNCGTAFEPRYLEEPKVVETVNLINYAYLSEPSFGDIDLDKDLDLIFGSVNGEFYIFENKGDVKSPQFEFTMSHLFTPIPGYTSPCLVDIDDDGFLDIVTGASDGRIYYLYNGQNGSVWSLGLTSPFDTIDVGDYSKPALADLDGDGDFDLTIGEDDANINYYRNIGTSQDPNWRVESSMYLGLPVTTQTSPELVDINGDRRSDLVVGCSNGQCYYFENIGTGLDAQWQVWSSYQLFPGIAYYDTTSYLNHMNLSIVDEYAQLIVDAKEHMKDEIAFSIAHTSTQALLHPDTSPGLYKNNAELMYEIDGYIEYANIVDHGTYNDRNYYSTIEYKYKTSDSTNYQLTKLPRDIYYWYVVHPKITDEIPAYINPDTGNPTSPPNGIFWREYLFYYNDTNYPADPPTDINDDGIPDFHYPKEVSPPLLKEKLSGINYVYDDQPYDAPRGYDNQGNNNTRPWGYKDHAIETISNWVAKTLPLNEQESADGERPIQPVRIARTHNGNCGELQDLTIAATRTALIPAVGLMLWGEDHVWNEFYERGWHQWDNYWSDGGAVIDNFMNYWGGWGQRAGSGVTKWHGDDYTSDVTEQYVPTKDLSTLTIYVTDRNGNPVDGARVMVGSHWSTDQLSGYQVTLPFPSIWNYTDKDGICTFKVATQEGKEDSNKNFSFKVISKLGNAEQGKTELEHAQDYEFRFTLDGRVPEADVNLEEATTPPSFERCKMEISYDVVGAYQFPPNPWVFNYHPQPITTNLDITSFICNESNFNYYSQARYRSGVPVECYNVAINARTENKTFELPDNDDWYFVVYNKDSIETHITIRFTAKLYEISDSNPVVQILKPENNQTFLIGDLVPVSIHYSDDFGLETIYFSYDDYELHVNVEPYKAAIWNDYWNTTGKTEGVHTISGRVVDTKGNWGYDKISIILEEPPAPPPPPPPPPEDETPPVIKITEPSNGTEYTIGDEITITGTAWDENNVTSLSLIIDSKIIDLFSNYNATTTGWSYTWASARKSPGDYKFNIRCLDASGNSARKFGYFILNKEYEDSSEPILTIDKPSAGQMFSAGDIIRVEGTVTDDVGVTLLELKLSDQPWQDITQDIKSDTWKYILNTEDLEVGDHMIRLRAIDAVGNIVEEDVRVELLDLTPPSIMILEPLSGDQFDKGMEVTIEGEVDDDVGLNELTITISGPAGTEKITKGIKLHEPDWSYSWDVPFEYTPGEYLLTVTAVDYAGNTDSDSITFNINPEKTEKKKEGGFLGMPGFECVIFIIAILMVLLLIDYPNKRIIRK